MLNTVQWKKIIFNLFLDRSIIFVMPGYKVQHLQMLVYLCNICQSLYQGDLETRPLIRSCLTKLDYEKKYFLRSKGGYLPYPNYGTTFLNSFFPFISKRWNNLGSAKQAKDLFDFKCQLKSDMKPSKIKHFSTGAKKTNSLLTRFRTGRTSLNLHKFYNWTS